MWLESSRTVPEPWAHQPQPCDSQTGEGTALNSSSRYSPGFSAQLMHFSLELQNACYALVKDTSINVKYAVLLFICETKHFPLRLKHDFGNLWPISPSCACSNKETHYEGYVSRQYQWFAARGRPAGQMYSSLHFLRSMSWHIGALIKLGLNARPISSHSNIYSNSKPAKKSKFGHTVWTQSSTDQQTAVKDTRTRVVLPVQKRNISLNCQYVLHSK